MPRLVDAVPVPGALPALGRATAVHLLCLFLCGIAAAAGIWVLPLVAWLSMEGVCAAIIGRMAGLPRWWFPINLLFFPLIYQSLGLEVPPSVFLVVFCAMLLVSGPAWLYRVPLFLSSDRAADKVCRLLPRTGEFRFIDLGCGTGSLLSAVARRRPNGCYTGIELAPLPFLCSCWMALRQPRNRSAGLGVLPRNVIGITHTELQPFGELLE